MRTQSRRAPFSPFFTKTSSTSRQRPKITTTVALSRPPAASFASRCQIDLHFYPALNHQLTANLKRTKNVLSSRHAMFWQARGFTLAAHFCWRTPMTPRSIRRAAERKAMKLARKAESLSCAPYRSARASMTNTAKRTFIAEANSLLGTQSPAKTPPPNRCSSRRRRYLQPSSPPIVRMPSSPAVPPVRKVNPNPV